MKDYQVKRDSEYRDPAIKFKTKAPSSIIISRHKEDHFIQPNFTPDPAKYNPNDTVISRRKRSTQCGFGKAQRFNYEIDLADQKVSPASYKIKMGSSSSRVTINRFAQKSFVEE